ncbi:hypothetical protein [Streptomyces sp. NBC_01294]|uniref:hypothetical protein n=1 Tax=Streptomyces sp. NBC_01294 TaxID=2903815 RepID=UPI002DDC5158|nr:hypothetical protein [Streptomyces sp. NBC_01294]WRZ55088.1 caspase family protein [Streptomyces sp. NBC_01294]
MMGGDPLLECDEGEFMRRWRELRRHPGHGEPLVVHFAGHGIQAGSGGLYLAASGGEAREDLLADTCVSFGRLLEGAENCGRPVLFLLDVCEAGQAVVQQQLADLAARRRQDAPRNVWIIGACTSGAVTYGARFSTATATILHQLADGDLDITPTVEYVPLADFAVAVDRHLARTDRAAGRPRQTLLLTPQVRADPEPQPFFRNPAHTADPRGDLLAGMDPRLREFALGCAPGLDPLHFATRAAGNPTANDILFSGRRSPLDRIQAWTERPACRSGTAPGGHRRTGQRKVRAPRRHRLPAPPRTGPPRQPCRPGGRALRPPATGHRARRPRPPAHPPADHRLPAPPTPPPEAAWHRPDPHRIRRAITAVRRPGRR